MVNTRQFAIRSTEYGTRYVFLRFLGEPRELQAFGESDKDEPGT